MKITIVGSVKFAAKIVSIYRSLEQLGHQPQIHDDMFGLADGTAKELSNDIEADPAATKRKHSDSGL